MDFAKCVVVGDKTSGKHELCAHMSDSIYENYIPTVIDNQSITILVNNKPCMMHIWDTAGQEDYERLRPLTYPCTDCFLLCYSCTSPVTFYNTMNWLKEIRLHCPNTPFILVCTNSDKRKDPEILESLGKQRLTPISSSEGTRLAKNMRASMYVEVCFENKNDIIKAFGEAVIAHRKNQKK